MKNNKPENYGMSSRESNRIPEEETGESDENNSYRNHK